MTISTLPMGGTAGPATGSVASSTRRDSGGYDFGAALAAATRDHGADRQPVGRRDDRGARTDRTDGAVRADRPARAEQRAGTADAPSSRRAGDPDASTSRVRGASDRRDGAVQATAGDQADDATAEAAPAGDADRADEEVSASSTTPAQGEVVPPTVSVATVVQAAAEVLLAPAAAALTAGTAGASTTGDLESPDASTDEAPATRTTDSAARSRLDAALLGLPAETTATGSALGAAAGTGGNTLMTAPLTPEGDLEGESALSARVVGRVVDAAEAAGGPVLAKDDTTVSPANAATSSTAAATVPTAAPNATPVNAASAVVPTQAAGPQPAVAVPAPVAAPVPVVAPSVADQIGVRLAGLRTAPLGEHIMTMRVDPESMGPIRVVAHIATDGVRIELLGGTDHAREALRAALPDLRRDLAATGLQADLDLAGQNRQNGGKDGDPEKQQLGSGTDVPSQVSRETVAAHPATATGRPGGLDLVL